MEFVATATEAYGDPKALAVGLGMELLQYSRNLCLLELRRQGLNQEPDQKSKLYALVN